jgi:fluoroquinolone transport system permease protein
MFGFIYSMVLIDEKETEVAKMYGVLPVSRVWYIIFRLLIPMLITTVITWIILIVQPFYDLSPYALGIFSFLAGLIVPVYVIGITNFSKNRMEGMVWIKVFNVVVLIPVAAFFVPGPLQHLFGIFPTHWAFQGMYSIIESNPYMWQLGLGFIYFTVLLIFVTQKFAKNHFI